MSSENRFETRFLSTQSSMNWVRSMVPSWWQRVENMLLKSASSVALKHKLWFAICGVFVFFLLMIMILLSFFSFLFLQKLIFANWVQLCVESILCSVVSCCLFYSRQLIDIMFAVFAYDYQPCFLCSPNFFALLFLTEYPHFYLLSIINTYIKFKSYPTSFWSSE